MQIKDYPLITTLTNPDLLLVQTANDSAYKSIEAINLIPSTSSSSSQVFPNNFTHWHDESIILSGSALLTDIYSNYAYSALVYQNPGAVGDTFQFYKLLDAGSYTFYLLGAQGSNRGIIRLNVNGADIVGDLDFFGNSFTGITLHTSITIAAAGMQTFKLTTVGKNPSSSAFYVVLTKLWGIKQ